MKKIITLIINSAILVSIVSCSKQLLDKTPLDVITDDVVWKDQALIDATLTGVYGNMYVFENNNDHHISSTGPLFTPFAINCVSDEAKSMHTWSFNANTYKLGGLKINGGLLEWWDAAYSAVRVLNDFIARVPTAPVDSAYKIQRVAEARFLRAYAYFAMVERYGGVPLITQAQEISAPKDSLFPKRATEAAIYDFVLSECDAISKILPAARASTEYGRPTLYAALALKCRAALYAASIAQYGTVQLNGVVGIDASKASYYYQQSYDAAGKIITDQKYSLYNKYPTDKVKNFRQLFLEKNNTEVIFARPHDNVSPDQGGNGWSYDFMQAPTPNAWAQGNNDGPYLETAQAFEKTDGSSGALDTASFATQLYTTDELWANRDPRFYATLYTMNTAWKGGKLDCHNGIQKPDGSIVFESYNGVLGKGPSTMNSGFGVMKYLDESYNLFGDFTLSSQDWIVFRYGEVLLNLAEAAFNLGKTNEALDAINQIRSRAGIIGKTAVTNDIIQHERQVELMFEGHRYWDLRRWRIATRVLSVNRSGLQYIYNSATGKFLLKVIAKLDGAVSVPQFYTQNYYLPVTLTRTGKNPNLVENPGYN